MCRFFPSLYRFISYRWNRNFLSDCADYRNSNMIFYCCLSSSTAYASSIGTQMVGSGLGTATRNLRLFFFACTACLSAKPSKCSHLTQHHRSLSANPALKVCPCLISPSTCDCSLGPENTTIRPTAVIDLTHFSSEVFCGAFLRAISCFFSF